MAGIGSRQTLVLHERRESNAPTPCSRKARAEKLLSQPQCHWVRGPWSLSSAQNAHGCEVANDVVGRPLALGVVSGTTGLNHGRGKPERLRLRSTHETKIQHAACGAGLPPFFR
jgi:hypothetical protein